MTRPPAQDGSGDGSAFTADAPRWRDVATVGGFLLLVAATAATTAGLTLVIVAGVHPVTGVAFLLAAATVIVVAILTMRYLRPAAVAAEHRLYRHLPRWPTYLVIAGILMIGLALPAALVASTPAAVWMIVAGLATAAVGPGWYAASAARFRRHPPTSGLR